jgi:type II restriction/modification system DNA methylase subunit YeeA
MDTNRLKTFAQRTRIDLMGQVARKLDAVLAPESDARREAPEAIRTLEGRIAALGRAGVVEQVAYTWFNRFTALRYMDVNGYLTPMVVSPAPDRTRPEILDQAAAGALPDHLRPAIATKVRDLLEGRAPSREPQVEAYRLLLVAACNDLSRVMPFLFEAIADYTELLMPNELLAADGWVTRMREVMTEDACQDVEIIGWLYQFYISEKKDQVFAGLKKNQKITAENIPAATQLFTPHWIVRYLVENSLGRLWLLNRPGSRLAERMEYYIAPEEPETDFLRISGPQEIRICDSACGSGHMLTYAFDLLYAIYEEEGVPPAEIPGLILTHNLTGIEIDDRAGALAAFALAMKAAAKLGRRRFLRMEVKPDIVVLENVEFTGQDRLGEFLRMIGQGSNIALADTLAQFGQAKNFGSLIVPKLKNPGEVLEAVRVKDFGGDIIWEGVRDRVVAVLRMAEALAPRYHVVVANPPYMVRDGMNNQLQSWTEQIYPDSKADLYAMFIDRAFLLAFQSGYVSMITMQSWMFLPKMEKIRRKVIDKSTIISMAHLGERGFDSIGGSVVSTTAFVAHCIKDRSAYGHFFRLIYGKSELEKSNTFLKELSDNSEGIRYLVSSKDFSAIPGSPIAYWINGNARRNFQSGPFYDDHFLVKAGISTGKNEQFIISWPEVDHGRIRLNGTGEYIYTPHNKGGEFRRWYGNRNFVLKYSTDHQKKMEANAGFRHDGRESYFREHVGWSKITSGDPSFRIYSDDFTFDSAGLALLPKNMEDLIDCSAFLNSRVAVYLTKVLSSTLNLTPQIIKKIPYRVLGPESKRNASTAITLSKSDWDAFETSWDFTTLPLLSPDHRSGTLEATYARLRAHWAEMTAEMQQLEEKNNRIFIDAYGLQHELSPEVPIEEITLTCNPAYRYGVKGTEEEREARLLADTMKELISYAIGCMFGRYSLDAPGLILANQGDTVQTYLDRIPNPSFASDRDNVIPLLEEDWFGDDAYERFREFLSLSFGPDRLVENLEFMKRALGKEVRTYLAKDFYADHVQRYKKRPIYWLVSSPKGAFQALIYMHRYSPDTLNITLNDYVRSLRDKLEAGLRAAKALEINPDASAAEKNRAKRDIDRLTKQIAEVTEWERDTLYPLAVERIRIDLDDGVKRNYPRFPGVLKPIKGLEDEDA